MGDRTDWVNRFYNEWYKKTDNGCVDFNGVTLGERSPGERDEEYISCYVFNHHDGINAISSERFHEMELMSVTFIFPGAFSLADYGVMSFTENFIISVQRGRIRKTVDEDIAPEDAVKMFIDFLSESADWIIENKLKQ